MSPEEALVAVQAALTDELRRPPWRGAANPLEGHCYVAAEALWHVLGGADSPFRPVTGRDQDGTHWWLEGPGGRLDPTAGQYTDGPPPYHTGRRCGFLTRQPSRRAQVVIRRVEMRACR